MTPDTVRPDPDALVDLANSHDENCKRGKLKIFFGAYAGVGKTYSMLQNARQLRDQGMDVVIGFVETHGRRDTEALLEGLEILPRRKVSFKGHAVEEFDVDAALQRQPTIVIVDELAHSNPLGCRHPKRWQDIEELMSAGVEVHSTLNVQHLESVNDVVNDITGIAVRETLPDRFFDAATEIVLVDLPPDDLLQRLREGKVYIPEQAERAIQHFFRKGNLIALRELALRRTADRVDDDSRLYRRDTSGGKMWHTRERLLACIGPAPGSEAVLRSASRMAAALNAELHVIHVDTPASRNLSAGERAVVMDRLRLAESLGALAATITDETVVGGITKYAGRNNVTKLVIGRSPHNRRWQRSERDFAQAITNQLPKVDVVITASEETAQEKLATRRWMQIDRLARWPYLIAALASVAVTLLLYPLHGIVDQTNIAMLFLAALVPVAMRLGRGPATLSAVLNVLGFDVFFVAPRFSLAVADLEYIVTFSVMLGVGLVIARLTGSLKFQASLALHREEQTREFYELAKSLAAALSHDQIVTTIRRAIKSQLGADAEILVPDARDRLERERGGGLPQLEVATAQWCYDRGMPAGITTNTLPTSPLHYVPLQAPMRVRGVVVLSMPQPEMLNSPDVKQQLATIAALAAIALERVHFVSVAQETLVKIESQRLRESLLASLSHDLRTPVTAILGIAASLHAGKDAVDSARAELLASLHRQAMGMARLVTNILDMARFQSDADKGLRKDWQSLEELVGAALHGLEDTLHGREVCIDIPADLPLLYADGVLIERVLVNLLENAVKYTPDDSRIGIQAQCPDADVAEITIWDEGPGLPPGDSEQLFSKFVRGVSESTISGVGLGLAICRAIVEAHGGSIRAENGPRGGSRFVIKLPLQHPPACDEEALDGAEA